MDENTKRHLKKQQMVWDINANKSNANHEISGFISSIDHNYFSFEELDEFIADTKEKLSPYLKNEPSILEIGVSGGFTLNAISPFASIYVGLDPSEESLKKCQTFLPEKKSHITLHCMFAHEIDTLSHSFDIIVINSVLQYFPNEDYAKEVFEKCYNLLNDNGILYLGDVMDKDLKDNLIKYIDEKSQVKQKHNYDQMLFFSKNFFTEELSYFKSKKIFEKTYTIENELSLFRYNVILQK